jgi:polyhydroxyalkanoate synthesis regulator phasin
VSLQRGVAQLLYDNSRQANESILTTLHFSLGLVAAFILALVGSQIFFNYRINKEEINSIRSDIDSQISTLSARLLEDMTRQLQSSEANLNSKIEEKTKLIEAKDEVRKTDIETIRNSFNALERKINTIEITLEESTGHLWNLRGVDANALSSFIKTATLKIKQKKNPTYTLDDIIKSLGQLRDIYIDDYSALDELVKKIPKECEDQQKKIDDIFRTKPVYEFLDTPDNSGKEWKYVKNIPKE